MFAKSLNGASAVQYPLGGNIGFVCQLRSIKNSEVNGFSCTIDRCPPFLAFDTHTKIANSGISMPVSHVLSVFCNGDIPKIEDPVVCAIPVNVVNNTRRPHAMDIQPCEAMRKIVAAINTDVNIPVRFYRASKTSGRGGRTRANSTNKFARAWVVVEKLTQTLRGKIGLSHDSVPSMIGQRPASVDALSRLRHFIYALSFAQRQLPNVMERARRAVYQWASPQLTGPWPQWGNFSHSQ